MTLLTADYLYSPEGWLKDHVLELGEGGRVLALRPRRRGDSCQSYAGALCPGWVNVHCHLELSFLRGKLPPGLGMTAFILQVVGLRQQASEEAMRAHALDAMNEAWATGTVAMGDTCNLPLTASLKRSHSLFTHSFVEILGVPPERAAHILTKGQETRQAFTGLAHSLSPHAPYSMSSALLELLYAHSRGPYSIHLLESRAERQLFEAKAGPFLDFYQRLGIALPDFGASSPIEHITRHMPPHPPIIWVHTTEITPEELAALFHQHPQAYVCLCPRANDYLHGRSPQLSTYASLPEDRLCLGTDSLANNETLDLFDEIRTLQQQHPAASLHQLIRMGTTNGGKALQQASNFGIFAVGARPGVNLIGPLTAQGGMPRLSPHSRVKKLA